MQIGTGAILLALLSALGGVGAHAASCFDLAPTRIHLPSWERQKSDLMTAARALREMADRGMDPNTTAVPELIAYFRNLIEHTRRDWLALGLAEAEVAEVLSRWEKLLAKGPNFFQLWDFVSHAHDFFRITLRWLPELRPKLSLSMAARLENDLLKSPRSNEAQVRRLARTGVFVLPMPAAVSFQIRAELFRLGTPPAVLNFNNFDRRSFQDQVQRGYFADLEHDVAHAESVFSMGFRAVDQKALDILWSGASGLNPPEQKIAFYFRDRLFSDAEFPFHRPLSFLELTKRVGELAANPYLRSQYWEVRRGNLYPVGQSEKVLDRRPGLLMELGLPNDMSWTELQALIDRAAKKLETHFSRGSDF